MFRPWKVLVFLLTLVAVGATVSLFLQPKASATWGCTTGGDHAGANFDPYTDCPSGLFAGVHTNIGTFHIDTGQTGTIQPYSGGSFGTASISATTVTITGTLTGVGDGYTPGAGSGYGTGNGSGAHGGNGAGTTGGVGYDSYTAPVLPGGASPYAAGGGAIQLTATGTTTVNGSITMKGGSTGSCSGQSAAAGGSVYVTTATFAGSGSINANGGDYGGGCGNSAAGGGGGRIAIYYSSSNTYSGSAPTVNAGAAGSAGTGQTGTCTIVDTTNNDLYINTSQTWNANPSREGSSVVAYHNITVSNNATWTFVGYNTTSSNGVGSYLKATNNFTLNAGSTLTADYQGYTTSTGPGAPTGVGGGGYGGAGGVANNGNAGGASYGSYSAPVDLGSGGTNGPGGGAIHVQALGTLTVSGTITANGVDGFQSSCGVSSPASGGSIYLQAGTFAGAATGIIRANGGAYPYGCGTIPGGGGGGRIYIGYSSADTYAGVAPTVNGGQGNQYGYNGTCFIVDTTNNDLYVSTSQTWDANPTHEGGTLTYRHVTITNNSTITIRGYATTSSNGVGIKFSVTNFQLDAGSSLNGLGLGYGGSSTAGPGAGGGTSSGGGGGGYGGAGGAGSGGAGGITYGSPIAPVDLGSAGSGGNGAAGGSAIQISATSTVTINGSIIMDGSGAVGGCPGAGTGSGGSIFIGTRYLAGTGSYSAKGGNYTNGCGGAPGAGGGGRIAIFWLDPSYTFAGTTTAAGGTGSGSGSGPSSAGTVIVRLIYHALADRSITMSSSAPGASSVSYHVVFTPTTAMTIGGIVVDICDNDPIYNDASCTYPTSFSWGASPSLTVNGGMGSGWTAAGVQGGASVGATQVLELSNATPQSVSSSMAVDFTITTATNPAISNHPFYARVLTFDTASDMTTEYTVSSTTRTSNTPDSRDHGGFALSTGAGVSLTFVVPETLSFCVSGSSIGSNCSGLTTPSLSLGHGSPKVLDATAVDKANAYVQTSTNALNGVIVRMVDGGRTVLDQFGNNYRLPITVNNTSNASTLTNYQVSVTVNTSSLVSAGKMRSDCGDARFTDSDQVTVLNYWLASGCNTSSTVFWVKVPSIPGSASKTIYLYYGNNLNTTLSSTTNTFLDDISGVSLAYPLEETSATNATDYSGNSNTGIATGTSVVTGLFGKARNFTSASDYITTTSSVSLSSTYSYSIWVNFPLPATGAGWRSLLNLASSNYHALIFDSSGNLGVYNSGFCSSGFSASGLASGWHHIAANASGSTTHFYVDGSSVGTASCNVAGHGINEVGDFVGQDQHAGELSEAIVYASSNLTTGQITDLGTSGDYGYVTPNYAGHELVRRYSSPEPTTSLGVETISGCSGLSSNSGASCGIPAVNTSCSGSCSATTITAGTAAIGMCVSAGSGSITVTAPYNGTSCGSGTTYGMDDATTTSLRTLYGSQIFSSSGMLNQENDTLVFAATASYLTPAGTYAGAYDLIATSTY